MNFNTHYYQINNNYLFGRYKRGDESGIARLKPFIYV